MLMKARLIKVSSVLVIASALLLGLSIFFNEPVLAAGCTLTSASWGASFATTGQPVQMNITGQDCSGYSVRIHAYTSSGGGRITPADGLTATFSNNTNTSLTYTFNPPCFTVANLIHFIASANNTQVQSNGIQLRIGTVPPPACTTPPPASSSTPPPAGTPGQSVNYQFNIPNPINTNDFIGLITAISKWIVAIAIPIAVIAIVYAGILWLTAGAYPKNVEEAKKVLKYALIGLAIIIIGRGFITLIESIINLGGDSGTPTTTQSTPPPSSSLPSTLPTSSSNPSSTSTPSPGKPVGSRCVDFEDCVSPLLCSTTSICRRPAGSLIGDPCKATSDCRADLTCNKETQNQQVVDGQTLGTCW